MKPQQPIVSDQWNSYVAERDGVTTFVSFDEELVDGKLPESLPLCTRVLIRIQRPNAVGAPVPPENVQLWEMEDDLVALLQSQQIVCRLTARLTFRGLRELVFQHADRNRFRTVVQAWIAGQQSYEADVSEHDGWKYFEDFVRPRPHDRQLMRDNALISALIEQGVDPDAEHEIRFSFSGSEEGLQRLRAELTECQYQMCEESDADSLQMSVRMCLDLQKLTAESLRNRELADAAGVEFHGWSRADAT